MEIQDIEEMPQGAASRQRKYGPIYDKLSKIPAGGKFRAGPFERRVADSVQSTIVRWIKKQEFGVTTSVRDVNGELVKDGAEAWVYIEKTAKE